MRYWKMYLKILQVTVKRWTNVPLNNDEVAQFIFLKDEIDQLLIIEKTTRVGALGLYG